MKYKHFLRWANLDGTFLKQEVSQGVWEQYVGFEVVKRTSNRKNYCVEVMRDNEQSVIMTHRIIELYELPGDSECLKA